MDKRTLRPMTEAEQARALGDIYAMFLRGASNEAEQDLLSEPTEPATAPEFEDPASRAKLSKAYRRVAEQVAKQRADDAQQAEPPTEPKPVLLEKFQGTNLTKLAVFGEDVRELVDLIQPFNEALTVLGVLLCRLDRRANFTSDVETLLRQTLGELVFSATIPTNIKAAEAPAAGQPVTAYAPDSSSAQAYRQLVDEVIYRIETQDEQA